MSVEASLLATGVSFGTLGEWGKVAPEEPTQRAITSLDVENLLFEDNHPQAVRRWTASAYRADLRSYVDAHSMNVGTTIQHKKGVGLLESRTELP